MSCVQPRGGRETRRPRGGVIACTATDQPTYRPSSEGQERHVSFADQPEIVPEMQSRNYMHGQQKSALRPPRNWSPSWQEERQPPPPRQPSPGWHGERGFADSDTLPARWRDDVQFGKQETRDINEGWPTSKGPKVHFQRPAERHQRTAEDDDGEEGGSASSCDNSLEGSLTIVEKDESRFEDRNHALSHSFEMIEDGDARSGDEDGYVHVSQGSPRVSAFEREKFWNKA